MATRIVTDHAAITQLMTSPAGPVGAYMARGGRAVYDGARRRAPVGENSKTPEGHPAGWLRDHIGWDVTLDGHEIVATVWTGAVTSKANPDPGEPYSLYQETGEGTGRAKHWGHHPYLVPALGDWPAT